MQVATRWHWLAIWLLTSGLAALSCSLTFDAAHTGSEYVPVGNDAFYHARRILDTVRDPADFYQFDTRIHAPEGSLLVWPWGYDYAMAALVKAGLALGISTDAMAILTWIPVAAVFLSIGLLVLLARQLQLPPWPAAIAALCMALAPTTQGLHGPGELDHHFAELAFLLATLTAGLSWLQKPGSWHAAALLGVLLGIAPAIHNGSFILQLPLLCAVFVGWLQQQQLPRGAARIFAATLLAASVAVLIPSVPFHLGRFEFYTLSWFHLYVAGCSAGVVLLTSHVHPDRKGMTLLLIACAVLAVPLLGEMTTARTFVGGMHRYLENIDEMRSPASAALKFGYLSMARVYSLLIYLAPVTFGLCLFQCWRDRAAPRLLFWITAALGLALLAAQQRMHYFGGFALYMPWLVVATNFVRRRPEMEHKVFLGVSLIALLCYAPVLRYQLLAPMPLANDPYFEGVRPLYATLQQECAKDPGIVLADNNAGHPIRFYTDCPVIANNFILTPQHFAKLAEADRLFALSAEQLAQQRHIKYLLIRALAMRPLPNGSFQYQFYFSNTAGLANQLLLAPESELPPNYTLLQQMSYDGKAPYARLFRIEHDHATVRPPQSAVSESR